MSKQSGNKKFLNIIIAVISLIIIVLLCMFLLDTTGKINQGSFRVNDVAIYSVVDVQDTTDQNNNSGSNTNTSTTESVSKPIGGLSELKLDISQKNEIMFLIAKSEGIDSKEIYIDNITMGYPILTEKMYIYQTEDSKIDLKTEKIKLNLNKEDKDGQYLIKFNIDNVNCLKGATIPNAETSITFDGKIFNMLNTKISDISFNIQFNLNILDSTGKLNVCTVKLNLPNELLITKGLSITKEDVGSYPFRIK